jgi:hypothetical protein
MRNATKHSLKPYFESLEKVFQLIEECLPLDAGEWADGAHNNGNLPPFMVAASCENCAASVIYYLLRRNVNGIFRNHFRQQQLQTTCNHLKKMIIKM